MSTAQLNNFLNALEAVKQDFECVVCSELCKNPVTLSKCFHLICSIHFDGLKTCPKCGTCLEGSTTFVDDRYQGYVDSARELDEIFTGFKSKENLQTSKAESSKSSARKRPKVLESKATKSKEVKDTIKPENSSRNDANTSLFSNASSKLNKGLEKRNNNGETPLHFACRLGKLDKASELIAQGANTNTKDNAGWTPLHEVVQTGRLDLVRLLLQHNSLVNVPGPSNETPLHEAVRYGHVEIAEELVKNGADINARNIKGETPLQLAKGSMKEVLETAVENIIQTQSVNVTHISDLNSEVNDDIRAYCVSSYRTVLNKLKLLAKTHNNVHIEAKLTKKVTHLIVDVEDGICQSSVDILQGIVSGVWILSSDWVTKSTEHKLEQFQSYEVVGVSTKAYNGPKNSRFNKYKQLPGIFNGCHFYLHNFTAKYEISKSIVLTKAALTKLITDAGGVVLRRVPNPELIPEAEKLVPYHAKKGGKLTQCSHFIIFKDMYEPMYNMQHLKALPIGWLIECIEKYELCEPW